ncbi:MAG TPA: response regulator [Planctomycetota bacterium]|nr:response regulator [Planctomycetota bacterium]
MSREKLERILCVEDEEDIRRIQAIALEGLGGFKVKACASGAEAIQEAPAFAPQLILLDVMMPGMDGPTTLKSLRTLAGLEETPVIFVTAKVQPDEVDYYLEIGALGVISKPFDPMTLAAQLKDIWELRHAR